MTITLKIVLFVLTCVLYILSNRLMRSLMPTWPAGGQLIALGLGALITTLWVEYLMGINTQALDHHMEHDCARGPLCWRGSFGGEGSAATELCVKGGSL